MHGIHRFRADRVSGNNLKLSQCILSVLRASVVIKVAKTIFTTENTENMENPVGSEIRTPLGLASPMTSSPLVGYDEAVQSHIFPCHILKPIEEIGRC